MKRQPQPVLITDAERSPHDDLRGRQIRYLAMMSIRALCLVVAAVLVSSDAPMLWLWLPLCVAGMVLLPWFAVLVANDRPPKERHRLIRRPRGAGPARPAPRVLAGDLATARTIDAEP